MRNAQNSLQSLQEALVSKNSGGEFGVIIRQNFVARLMNSKHESAVAFKNALMMISILRWLLQRCLNMQIY